MWRKPISVDKPATPEARYEQALVTARLFIDDNNAKVSKQVEQYEKVANSTYWSYGYMGSSMVTTMALCLSIGSRVPVLRTYASWISLAGGYFGGKAVHGLHNSYNMAQTVKTIDTCIEDVKKMDESTGGIIVEYSREVDRLTKMRHECMPNSPEALEARASSSQSMSVDERANMLIESYNKRKEALSQKK